MCTCRNGKADNRFDPIGESDVIAEDHQLERENIGRSKDKHEMRRVAENLHIGHSRCADDLVRCQLHDAEQHARKGAKRDRKNADQHVHGKAFAKIGQPVEPDLTKRRIKIEPECSGQNDGRECKGRRRQPDAGLLFDSDVHWPYPGIARRFSNQ